MSNFFELKNKYVLKSFFFFLGCLITTLIVFLFLSNYDHPVEAANVLTNPSFTGGTTGWTLTNMTYDSTTYQDSAGAVNTYAARKGLVSGTAVHDSYTSISSTDTVTLSGYWMFTTAGNGTATLYIEIEEQSNLGNWTEIWNSGAQTVNTAWTAINNLDVSSSFGTGSYRIRLRAELDGGAGGGSDANAWFDNLNLDVSSPVSTITVGTTGTQTSSVEADTLDFYTGGAFAFVRNSDSTSVTSITVSETGTIADADIGGLTLYYKQEATCSTSIPVDATQFNSTAGTFTSGSSTVTGTMSVGTSQVCVYAEVDIGSGASADETIEIEITDPSTQVTASAGDVSPSTAVAISGTTTVAVNQPPSFSAFSHDGPTDPGSNITFTATASDPDSNNVTLVVCKTQGVTGTECDGGSTDTLCTGTLVASDPSCSYTIPTPTPDTTYNAYPYVFDSNNLGSDSALQGALDTYTVNNVAPVVSGVTLNGGSPIDLVAGSTKAVNVTGSVTDNNSCQDISSVLGYAYRSGIGYEAGDPGTWWNTDWDYRRTLTFDNSSYSETFTNFPVMVKLNSSRIDYAKILPNGEDLRFVSSTGTLLDHEIEYWNTSGDSFIWVNVPEITASSNTDYIYVYYGNILANDVQNPGGVWDNNFTFVHHLNDNSTTQSDSTQHGNDGTLVNTPVFSSTAGVSGDPVYYFARADNDHIAIPYSSTSMVRIDETHTAEMWINSDSVDPGWFSAIVYMSQDSGGTGTDQNIFAILYSAGSRMNSYNTAAEVGFDWNWVPNTNTWYYVVTKVEGSNIWVYVNGSLQGSGTQSRSNANTGQYLINARGGGDRGSTGYIDNVRVSNTTRSDAWIAAQYDTKTDTYITYGTEELAPEQAPGTGCSTSTDANDNNCYPDITCTVDTGTCPDSTVASADYTCTVNLQYFADPTDTNTQYPDDTWMSTIKATDNNSLSHNTELSTGVDLNSLMAFNITNEVNYGALGIGESNDPLDRTTVITPTGNIGLDHEVSGPSHMCTDFPTCSGYTIAIEHQKYAISSSTAYNSATALSTTPTTVATNVPKPTTTTPLDKSVWWGMLVPEGTNNGSYDGTITITGLKSAIENW